MKNTNLSEIARVATHTVMFKEGIVPMEDPRMDVRRALKDLPPEEARKMKRKFRKLWRSLEKGAVKSPPAVVWNHVLGSTVPPPPTEKVEVAVLKPSKGEKWRRKNDVLMHLQKTKIAPLVKQMTSLKKLTRKY